MLNFDPRRPIYRALFLVLGAVMIGFGLTPLRHGSASYETWWGGSAFAPFAIIFGVIILVGAIFKPTIFGRQPGKSK
jgi:hypothetical protein